MFLCFFVLYLLGFLVFPLFLFGFLWIQGLGVSGFSSVQSQGFSGLFLSLEGACVGTYMLSKRIRSR